MSQKKKTKSWWDLKDFLHTQLVHRIDPGRMATIADPQLLHLEVRLVVERLVDTANPLLNRMERERLIEELIVWPVTSYLLPSATTSRRILLTGKPVPGRA